jgi:N12 class adenine-specific DNA methylase
LAENAKISVVDDGSNSNRLSALFEKAMWEERDPTNRKRPTWERTYNDQCHNRACKTYPMRRGQYQGSHYRGDVPKEQISKIMDPVSKKSIGEYTALGWERGCH